MLHSSSSDLERRKTHLAPTDPPNPPPVVGAVDDLVAPPVHGHAGPIVAGELLLGAGAEGDPLQEVGLVGAVHVGGEEEGVLAKEQGGVGRLADGRDGGLRLRAANQCPDGGQQPRAQRHAETANLTYIRLLSPPLHYWLLLDEY